MPTLLRTDGGRCRCCVISRSKKPTSSATAWEAVSPFRSPSGTPLLEEYTRVAPNPDDFPTLVAKLKQLDGEPLAWPPEDIRAIEAPTLLIIGDSEGTRPEHAVEMFRLLGGDVMGDLAGLPMSRLAVLPGTTHFGPRLWGPGPRRLAGRDDRRVPRRAYAGGRVNHAMSRGLL